MSLNITGVKHEKSLVRSNLIASSYVGPEFPALLGKHNLGNLRVTMSQYIWIRPELDRMATFMYLLGWDICAQGLL